MAVAGAQGERKLKIYDSKFACLRNLGPCPFGDRVKLNRALYTDHRVLLSSKEKT
jgi:hypothetical protein